LNLFSCQETIPAFTYNIEQDKISFNSFITIHAQDNTNVAQVNRGNALKGMREHMK